MSRVAVLLCTVLMMVSAELVTAAPSKDQDLLRTLQSLTDKSVHKRLMNLSAMGPQAYKKLQEISFNSQYTPETRAEAFRTAVLLGRENSEPEIKRAAEHKDWFMRALALEAYSHIQPSKARALSRNWLLNDNALMVRAAALARLHEEPMTSELKEVLLFALKDQKNFHRGQSLWIRGRIADTLLKLDPKDHLSVYQTLLQDRDTGVQQRTVAKLRAAYPGFSESLEGASAWLAMIESRE